MFTPDELAQAKLQHDAYMASLQPQRAAAPRTQPQKKKNFLVDQISTLGGIVGGIGGSFISPIAGTAGGAALGSGLGEAIENAITGNKLTNNVAKEAALGGVFGAGPIKLLKGGAALATGKGIEGATQAALTPLRQQAGKILTNAADDLAVKQFRLTPAQLDKYVQKFKEDAGTTIRKYGFQTADDVESKGIAPLQQAFDQSITSIPGVTKDSLQKNLLSRINRLSTSGPSDTKALGGQLKTEANNLLKGYGDVIDAKELNTIRRQFDDLVNYTQQEINPARYTVNKHMADAIRETLQKADPTGDLKVVGKELQKLRQLSDNVARQGQLGRGSLPLNIPTLLGGAAGGAAFGPAGLGTAAGVAAINSPTGRKLAMAGADKLGSKLLSSGSAEQSIKGIAGRIGGEGVYRGLRAQQTQPQSLEDALLNQSLANNAMSPSSNPNATAAINADMSGLSQDIPQESSPYTRDNLLADIQRDPQNASKYMEYYNNLQEVFAPPKSAKSLGSTAANTVTDLTNGIANIQQLSQQFAQSGANKPIIGNLLASNPFNTDAQSLRANIARVKQVIGKALEGGVLRKEDEVKYQKILPTLNDTDAVAQNKINAIAQDLQRKLAIYQQNVGAGNSLEDALLQYQQQPAF